MVDQCRTRKIRPSREQRGTGRHTRPITRRKIPLVFAQDGSLFVRTVDQWNALPGDLRLRFMRANMDEVRRAKRTAAFLAEMHRAIEPKIRAPG